MLGVRMNRLAATSPNPEVPPVITMVFILENGLVSTLRVARGRISGRRERQGDWVWRLTRWISAIKKLGIDKLSFRPTPLGSACGEACAATLSHNLKFSNTIVNRHN